MTDLTGAVIISRRLADRLATRVVRLTALLVVLTAVLVALTVVLAVRWKRAALAAPPARDAGGERGEPFAAALSRQIPKGWVLGALAGANDRNLAAGGRG